MHGNARQPVGFGRVAAPRAAARDVPPVSEWAAFTDTANEARHALETLLARRSIRRRLGAMTKPGADGGPSWFERLCEGHHRKDLDPLDRLQWMLPSAILDLAIRLAGAHRTEAHQ